jgi:metal transporter CNNM
VRWSRDRLSFSHPSGPGPGRSVSKLGPPFPRPRPRPDMPWTTDLSWLTWIAIGLCLSQSATLSGLNLACFRSSRLFLEVETAQGNRDAKRLLALREDANFLLATILWGNVAVNVLLALLSGSVMTGVAAFLFSTVVITVVGEILPQAWFSRHALRVASALSPVIRGYQLLLFPVAKSTALILDLWLGREAIVYYEERDLRDLLRLHAFSSETEIGRMEGMGALNFLDLDDLPLRQEGEPVDPRSIVELEFEGGRPRFPALAPDPSDPFLKRIHDAGQSWIVLVDGEGAARLVLDADGFLRDALFRPDTFDPLAHCHRPLLFHDGSVPLGRAVPRFRVEPAHGEDDVLEEDILLLWGDERRVITGTDLLGRLLRGVVRRGAVPGGEGLRTS